MKKSTCVILLAALAFLVSCDGKTAATIESASTDGKVKVKIDAKRSSAFDPFQTTISVNAYTHKEGKLVMEIMAGDLNSENVKFKWLDDNNCIITIEERDKHVRSFQLIANESQLQLGEI